MQLVILKNNESINSILFNKEILNKIEFDYKNKELLGQIIYNGELPHKKLDPNKISHIIKNIKFNKVLNALTCEIEFISTPYGEQLYLINKNNKNVIKWWPIFINGDIIRFISINAEIKNEKI